MVSFVHLMVMVGDGDSEAGCARTHNRCEPGSANLVMKTMTMTMMTMVVTTMMTMMMITITMMMVMKTIRLL